MRLFVTGGAGHTGCNFLKLFLSDDRSNEAVVLVRPTTDRSYLPTQFAQRLRLVEGDLLEESVAKLLGGCDSVMHIAHQTLSGQIGKAAIKAGVKRVLFVTTTGIFSKFNDLTSDYRLIEDEIKNSNLDWTILRPTMIYGSERDVNLHKLLMFLDSRSVFPVFGDGRGLMQPVFAEDLASGLLLALKNSDITTGREYNLPGRSPLTYNEILKTTSKHLGARTKFVHLPYQLSLALSIVLEQILGIRSPIKAEQVRRLSEDKAFSWTAARDDFGYNPSPFSDGIAQEIKRLRDLKLLKLRINF